MKRSDVLQKLEERLARGEISEKTYLDIKARYASEPEPPETASTAGPDLGASIHEAVGRATAEAVRAQGESMRAVSESIRAVGESMRAARDSVRSIDFSGFGVKLTEEEIKILGSGVVSGNPVRTVEFKAAGSALVRGPLEAETVKVAGSCDFDGDVHCQDFKSSGSSRCSGSLQAADVDVSGALEVAKDVDAADISVSGTLHVEGAVRCQDFRSSGTLRISGELKAADVDIELGGASQIGSIVGQDISVRSSRGFVRAQGELTVDRIVGQDIELLGTVAKSVEGHDVRIGPHCHIDVVTASELVVHESSEVKERRLPGS